MQYLGGKSHFGRKVVDAIERWREPGIPFVDVFCGALNVVRHASPPHMALDLCKPLVMTLRAARDGWQPPQHIPESLYRWVRSNPDPNDPLTAFVLFGCSYGGKWGAGYARATRGTDYVQCARNFLMRKAAQCWDLEILNLDYRLLPDPEPGLILYCDPPYRGTTPYSGVPPFDSDLFWAIASAWSLLGAFVFVSEETAPDDWVILERWILKSRLDPNRAGRTREERLYVHRDSLMGRAKVLGLV